MAGTYVMAALLLALALLVLIGTVDDLVRIASNIKASASISRIKRRSPIPSSIHIARGVAISAPLYAP